MKNAVSLFLIALVLTACSDNENTFDASGTFEAVEVVISSSVTGTIQALNIREGATVKAGELLGWIDSAQLSLRRKQLVAQIDAILSRRPDVAKQLASYRVQLETAERELARVRSLFQAEAATRKQVDDAEAQVSLIRRQIVAHRSSLDITSQSLVNETLPLSAQIDQLEDQLRKCRIVNPIDGTVLTRYAEAYEFASPGKPLYKVADIGILELRAYISGSQLPSITLDQPVTVFVDNSADGYTEYPGRISWISDKAEFTPKTIQTKEERTDLVYAIKIAVENDGHLKIGMYGEVRF